MCELGILVDRREQARGEEKLRMLEGAEAGASVIGVHADHEGLRAFHRLTSGEEEGDQHHLPAISRIRFHSSSRTGATDSRDWRINSILARRGWALICASVTGGRGRT